MFHFPTFPPHTLYIQATVTGHNSSWVTPFGHPRINARLPTPQGLSQAPTSFIGSRCQGIHRMLLVACQTPQRHTLKKQDARVHYAVLKIRAETPLNPPPNQNPKNPSRFDVREAHNQETRKPLTRRGSPDSSGPNSVPRHPNPPVPCLSTPQTQRKGQY
jgi:hypothetical protein